MTSRFGAWGKLYGRARRTQVLIVGRWGRMARVPRAGAGHIDSVSEG